MDKDNKITVNFSETQNQQVFKLESSKDVGLVNDIVSNIGILLRKKTMGFLDVNVTSGAVVINDVSKLSLDSRGGLKEEISKAISYLTVNEHIENKNQMAGKASLINKVDALSEIVEYAISKTGLDKVFSQVEAERIKLYKNEIPMIAKENKIK